MFSDNAAGIPSNRGGDRDVARPPDPTLLSQDTIGQAMPGILTAFAQLEAERASERTKSGLQAARGRGKKLGRAPEPGPSHRT